MVNSQEIIERSIYTNILEVTKTLGYTVDPNDYLPVSEENSKRLKADIQAIAKSKGHFIEVFGTANNASKDAKKSPRIVVDARGFFPGGVGLEKQLLEKQVGIGYTATEEPYSTVDQYINIHLVANNQRELRLLHQILFQSIPVKGYIKPYTESQLLFTGNIFIELINFYDSPNLSVGLMEKVYEFSIEDTLMGESDTDIVYTPINDISLLLEKYNTDPSLFINVNNN